ncbi:hypothetical protein EON63_02335 [archaeon]|nr:MAG: hypothetical protein EON63_02335 [archaeon]
MTKLSHNTKKIRFEIPHARPLGLTIGKHISIQAHIDGQRVMRAYTPSSPIYTQVCVCPYIHITITYTYSHFYNTYTYIR